MEIKCLDPMSFLNNFPQGTEVEKLPPANIYQVRDEQGNQTICFVMPPALATDHASIEDEFKNKFLIIE